MKTITITTAHGTTLVLNIEHVVIENAFEDLFPLPPTDIDEVHVTTTHKDLTYTNTFFKNSFVTLLPQYLFPDPDIHDDFCSELARVGAARVLLLTGEGKGHPSYFALTEAEADRLDAAVASAFED